MRVLCLAALAAVILLQPAHSYGQEASRVALVTDVTGSVEVARSGSDTYSAVTWGLPLYEEDHIKIASDGRASLLFANNNVLNLGPNSAMTISSDAVTSESLSAPVRQVDGELLAEASDLTLHRAGAGEIAALGGLRSGGSTDELTLLYPANTKLMGSHPAFTWSAGDAFERYTLSISTADGEVWSSSTSETSLQYPEDAPSLQTGITYYWQVDGEQMLDSVESPVASFELLGDEAKSAVSAGLDKLDSLFKDDDRGSDYHYVLGTFYASHGLLGDAVREFEWIAQLHPGSPSAHRILGGLYSDIGMKDAAIASLQRAVDLSQSN